jgi:hypothetical protein
MSKNKQTSRLKHALEKHGGVSVREVGAGILELNKR